MSTIEDLKEQKETIWINHNLQSVTPMSEMGGQKFVKVRAAQNRLIRFMPYIASAFPETAPKKGLIESDLLPADDLMSSSVFSDSFQAELLKDNHIFIKDDAHLPIAGSVKARGGIHEVLAHAEKLMQHEHLLMPGDDYSEIDSDEFREFFSNYTIQVGSTGNLGLSIGIMSAKLGFKVIVHMSNDAKAWKKDLLRSVGAKVKEYDSDYSTAVAEGRLISSQDPNSYFIDDENSEDLFFGYSTAALRLKVQLYKANVCVDHMHPLFVYLPCGVGGAPGGITFGLKQMFGDDVHCFFAEPTGAPSFTLGMASGKKNEISVQDIGLSGKTEADGLAVGRASGFVCNVMDSLVSGSFTVSDKKMSEYMKAVYDRLGLFLEPSACAGFHGLTMQDSEFFRQYLDSHALLMQNRSDSPSISGATHIIWATGGGLVPEKIMSEYLS